MIVSDTDNPEALEAAIRETMKMQPISGQLRMKNLIA